MRVEFVLRTPGSHTTVSELRMSSVPQKDDLVTLDGQKVYSVHEVMWNLELDKVAVLLRE